MNLHSDSFQKLRYFLTRTVTFTLLFTFAFLAGSLAARFREEYLPPHQEASGTATLAETENWGLSFQKEGERPVANATAESLKKYNAYYADMTDEKVIYLTFDAGYENGNTPAILDALKKHEAPAAFFVVGTYIGRQDRICFEI